MLTTSVENTKLDSASSRERISRWHHMTSCISCSSWNQNNNKQASRQNSVITICIHKNNSPGSLAVTFGRCTQGVCRVIANALHNSESFGLAFSEKYSVTRSEEFRSLDESEGNKGSVPSSNEGAVNVNHSTGLADSPNMKHSLISGLDGGRVG